MAEEKIEVIEAEDGKMPLLTDDELDALGREVWNILRLRAGAVDVARVTGILMSQVLLQITGDPAQAFGAGLQLLQTSITAILDAHDGCDCGGHGMEPEGGPEDGGAS